MTHTWPGVPRPLGAGCDGTGTNLALFSEVADGVELCLFDRDGPAAGETATVDAGGTARPAAGSMLVLKRVR